MKLTVLTTALLYVLTVAHVDGRLTEHALSVRRFLHGCPFAFPCPLPPCDNPTFGPGNCCGSCPEMITTLEPTTTTTNSADELAPETAKRDAASFLSSRLSLRDLNNHGLDRLGNGGKKRYVTPPTKSPDTTTAPPCTGDECSSTPYPIPTASCSEPCEHEGVRHCSPINCTVLCVDGVKFPHQCCTLCLNGKLSSSPTSAVRSVSTVSGASTVSSLRS